MKSDKHRTHTRIAVYLVGIKDNHVLLGKRKNTDFMNNCWSLPAGHVNEYETCLQAIVREIQEECGVTLHSKNLELKGSMHHFSGDFDYINYIFLADLSNYVVVNSEPEKCEMLQFFSINNLPMPMYDYIRYIIQMTLYSKSAWIAEYDDRCS